MSRILGLQYGRTSEDMAGAYRQRAGFYTPDAVDRNRQKRNTMMQANSTRYGGDHKGLMSFRDGIQLNRDLLDKMASQQYAGDNAEGILKLAVLDRHHHSVPNTPFELGGRTFRTNHDGFARLVDAERLNIELEAHNQIEQYELKILKAIMISNDMAQRMLDDQVYNKLGSGGRPVPIPGQPVSPDIAAVDAHPDVIKFLDPSSIEYSRALVKLKAAVSEAGVILNEDNQKLRSAVHMPNAPKQQAVPGTP